MELLKDCYAALRAKTDFCPDVALVLGSGLGSFAETLEIEASIPFSALPHFPVSTVEGHSGRFVFGTASGVRVAVMQGRVHYYEGYPMEKVVLPIRLLGLLGAKTLILTNSAGGIRSDLFPGAFVAITDQISSFVPSPLIGQNPDELGTRFPDMSSIYDPSLRATLHQIADTLQIPLLDGVYLQTSGPNYESPAEVRMYAKLGADLVGMSTACESIAARHMGMRVCGISLVSNMAAGISTTPPSHTEVQAVGAASKNHFIQLLSSFLQAL